MSGKIFGFFFLFIIAASSFACSGGGGGNVSLSLTVPVPPGGLRQVAGRGYLTLDDGSSVLNISSAELVLRRIEFKRRGPGNPCDAPEDSDSACDEFKTDPVLVSLPASAPLDNPVETELTASVPDGTYTRIDFDIHKVGGDEADDAFVARHPDFEEIRVRVLGDFDGNSCEFTSDLDEEQKQLLASPLVITMGEGANVTLRVDVSGWFVDGNGDLIGPATANDGGPNENRVKDNIRASIEAFSDEDRDGSEDD